MDSLSDRVSVAFIIVSLLFALSALITGIQGILNPTEFAKFFGLPLESKPQVQANLTKTYVSLMSVRQLGTGLTLVVFAWQNKWIEVATVLAIIGIVVAGTDGVFLIRNGQSDRGRFHMLPGFLISTLASAFIYYSNA